ncbi:RNA cap guanine-N2 methyltransferase [Trinorchestia longiramus]|nr:RNA cap guanine-N2 methyltransferase [Trinorchestia longiramus]
MAAPVTICSWKSHSAHQLINVDLDDLNLYVSEFSCNEYNDNQTNKIQASASLKHELTPHSPVPQDYTITYFNLDDLEDYRLPDLPEDIFAQFSSYWSRYGVVLCRVSWSMLYPQHCSDAVCEWRDRALRSHSQLTSCMRWLCCYHDFDAQTANFQVRDCDLVDSEEACNLQSLFNRFIRFRYVMHQLMVYYSYVFEKMTERQSKFLVDIGMFCECMKIFYLFPAQGYKAELCKRKLLSWRHLLQHCQADSSLQEKESCGLEKESSNVKPTQADGSSSAASAGEENSDTGIGGSEASPHADLATDLEKPINQRNTVRDANSTGFILNSLLKRSISVACSASTVNEDYIPVTLRDYPLESLVFCTDTDKVVVYDKALFQEQEFKWTEEIRFKASKLINKYIVEAKLLRKLQLDKAEGLPESIFDEIMPRYLCCKDNLPRQCLTNVYDSVCAEVKRISEKGTWDFCLEDCSQAAQDFVKINPAAASSLDSDAVKKLKTAADRPLPDGDYLMRNPCYLVSVEDYLWSGTDEQTKQSLAILSNNRSVLTRMTDKRSVLTRMTDKKSVLTRMTDKRSVLTRMTDKRSVLTRMTDKRSVLTRMTDKSEAAGGDCSEAAGGDGGACMPQAHSTPLNTRDSPRKRKWRSDSEGSAECEDSFGYEERSGYEDSTEYGNGFRYDNRQEHEEAEYDDSVQYEDADYEQSFKYADGEQTNDQDEDENMYRDCTSVEDDVFYDTGDVNNADNQGNRYTRRRHRRGQKAVPIHVSAEVAGFYSKRHRFFSLYDRGVLLDTESWYSVTIEPLAIHHAARCAWAAELNRMQKQKHYLLYGENHGVVQSSDHSFTIIGDESSERSDDISNGNTSIPNENPELHVEDVSIPSGNPNVQISSVSSSHNEGGRAADIEASTSQENEREVTETSDSEVKCDANASTTRTEASTSGDTSTSYETSFSCEVSSSESQCNATVNVTARSPVKMRTRAIDGFCGAGGNVIHLARQFDEVIAIDIDQNKLEMAKHNAKIYNVDHRISFHHGNYYDVVENYEADVVLLSPPWGGPDYGVGNGEFDLSSLDLRRMLTCARKVAPNALLFLPRSSNLSQIMTSPFQLITSPFQLITSPFSLFHFVHHFSSSPPHFTVSFHTPFQIMELGDIFENMDFEMNYLNSSLHALTVYLGRDIVSYRRTNQHLATAFILQCKAEQEAQKSRLRALKKASSSYKVLRN